MGLSAAAAFDHGCGAGGQNHQCRRFGNRPAAGAEVILEDAEVVQVNVSVAVEVALTPSAFGAEMVLQYAEVIEINVAVAVGVAAARQGIVERTWMPLVNGTVSAISQRY